MFINILPPYYEFCRVFYLNIVVYHWKPKYWQGAVLLSPAFTWTCEVFWTHYPLRTKFIIPWLCAVHCLFSLGGIVESTAPMLIWAHQCSVVLLNVEIVESNWRNPHQEKLNQDCLVADILVEHSILTMMLLARTQGWMS